jgi:hypothetical protein
MHMVEAVVLNSRQMETMVLVNQTMDQTVCLVLQTEVVVVLLVLVVVRNKLALAVLVSLS